MIRYIIWNIKVKAENIKYVIKAKYIPTAIYSGILKYVHFILLYILYKI